MEKLQLAIERSDVADHYQANLIIGIAIAGGSLTGIIAIYMLVAYRFKTAATRGDIAIQHNAIPRA